MKIPLFSVVISCYNSRLYIDRLLNSLVKQGISKKEYEVIISDDCSTESYDDIVAKYEKKLTIRRVTARKHYGYPGHTREMGMNACIGDWIVFSDHDDVFEPNALKSIKKYIKENDPKYCITSKVVRIRENGRKENYFNISVTHGKFYNKLYLIDAFDIHYTDKIFSNEDVYFTSIVNALYDLGLITINNTNIHTYTQYLHSDSISGELFEYLYNTIDDNIRATTYAIELLNERGIVPDDYYLGTLIDETIKGYLSIQFYSSKGIDHNTSKILEVIKEILDILYYRFEYNVERIIDYISEDDWLVYKDCKTSTEDTFGMIVEKEPIKEFLDKI